jgi:L-amino acid N-acyltransferase YncA
MQSSSAIASPVIRDATTDDVASICGIYNYYVLRDGDLVTFEEAEVQEAEMQRRHDTITDKLQFPFLVACIDEVVVGYAYGNQFKERSAYRFSAESTVYLHPEYQRRGVGTSLMAALMPRLAAKGVKQVVAVLGTQEDNPGSYRLHNLFGFKTVARYPKIGYKFGKWVDRIHMQCSLLTLEEEAEASR